MKKVLLTIAIVTLALNLSGATVKIDNIYYSISDNGTAMVMPNEYSEGGGGGIVIGLNNGYDGDVVIPESITYDGAPYTVTSAYEGTFANSTKMTSISLPSTLTSLGSTPFTSCTKLTDISVDAANPVYSSENGVLFNKDKTSLISCPAAKTGSYEVPSSVKRIEASAFYGCSRITSITLPSSLEDIGTQAFRACITLTSINLPDGLKTIRTGVFRGCSSMKEITLPSSVTTIEPYAFYYCQSLQSIKLPSGVTYLGDYSFGSCVKLAYIQFPDVLETIGERAFDNCIKLSSITLPVSLNTLGTAAFRGCSNLQTIVVAEGNNSFIVEDGVLYDINKERLICCPCKKTGVLNVASYAKSIDNYAFYLCRYLTGINFPLGLTSIGLASLSNCTSLTEIVLPNTVTYIDKSAFITCTNLQRVKCYAVIPPETNGSVFSSSAYSLPLYVPASSINAYNTTGDWKNFTTVLPLPESVSATSSDAYVYATTKIYFNLHNSQTDIKAYQFDLYLPSGFSLIEDNGSEVHNYSSRHLSTPTFSVTNTPEGGYRLTTTINDGSLITGNDGEVLTIPLKVDEPVTAGTYTGSISSGYITYNDGNTYSLTGGTFDIIVNDGLLGDVNNDQIVSLADIMVTVDFILTESGDFKWQLGDVNRDGSISLVDVMEMVAIVLNQ